MRARLSQCQSGNGAECYAAGQALLFGDEIAREPGRAVRLFERACDLDHGLGCVTLASRLDLGLDVPADPKRAERLYLEHCRPEGIPWACYGLARFYLLSLGGEAPDRERALEYLESGCEYEGPGWMLCATYECYQKGGLLSDCVEQWQDSH